MVPKIPFLTPPGDEIKHGETMESRVGTYIIYREPGVLGARRERHYFTEFTWRNAAGLPRSVTRTQVMRAFTVIWERYERVQKCYDSLALWWMYSAEAIPRLREVRKELRERIRGLYWTVATMQHQLNFLTHIEHAAHVPDSWVWTPGLSRDLFPVTATKDSIPRTRFQLYRNLETIDDFTFRVTDYVNQHGEPPLDARTEQLAALAVHLSTRRGRTRDEY